MFRLLKDELTPKEGVGMRDSELSRSASAQTLEIAGICGERTSGSYDYRLYDASVCLVALVRSWCMQPTSMNTITHLI